MSSKQSLKERSGWGYKFGNYLNKGNGKCLDWLGSLIKRAYWHSRERNKLKMPICKKWREEKLAKDTENWPEALRNQAQFSSTKVHWGLLYMSIISEIK